MSLNNKYFIEINNVSKSFDDVKVLDQVSARFRSNFIYGIVGRNGSGKTVLFKTICGFLQYDSGIILVNGQVMGRDLNMLTDAGIIIEEPAFLSNWNAYRNLEFLYRIRHRKKREYLSSIIHKVGLDPGEKKVVGKYSMGMRQRLAIAQAIMEDPPVLILDEPMNGLDNQGVEDMRKLFLEMKNRGKLIILASHNKDDIDTLCDKVFYMENGKLQEMTTLSSGTEIYARTNCLIM